MKKLLTLLTVAMLGLGTTYAQTVQQSATTTSTQKTKHVTKSGAADKRYKENKTSTTTAAAVGPTKKDGTADMRYKANKITTTKTTTKPKN